MSCRDDLVKHNNHQVCMCACVGDRTGAGDNVIMSSILYHQEPCARLTCSLTNYYIFIPMNIVGSDKKCQYNERVPDLLYTASTFL